MTERKRVLIIDDQRSVAEMLLAVLQAEGLEAAICLEPERALAQALAFQPHLIVLDLVMPGRSGSELLEDLRRTPATAQTPVLLITAYYSASAEIQIPPDARTQLIEKPFDIDNFVERVRWLTEASTESVSNTAEISR